MPTSKKVTSKRSVQRKDAMNFLDKVQAEFSENKQVFQRFLTIMADFQSESIGTTQVLERVTQLFNGHSVLIHEFLQFLPPGHIAKSDDKRIEIDTPSGERIIVDSSTGIA